MKDFSNIEYLKSGNARQRQAYDVLSEKAILSCLKEFDPLLVGTIPIGIDLEQSDLDIICHAKDIDYFFQKVSRYFSHLEDFVIRIHLDRESVVAKFLTHGFDIEIFGQPIPSTDQYGYRHMLIEHQLLVAFGENFRKEIIRLKSSGCKTEPAFALALGLRGNPYEVLLACNLDEMMARGWPPVEHHHRDSDRK